MKKVIAVLVMSLVLFSIQTVSTNAATSKLTLTVLQTPGGEEPIVTLYGNLKPAKSAVKVEIQIQLNGKWQDTRFSTRTARVGTWKVIAVATALNAQVKYRAKVQVGSKSIYSNIREIPFVPFQKYQMHRVRLWLTSLVRAVVSMALM